MRYFSNALNSILTPIIATVVMGLAGMKFIIWFDLSTFFIAFVILLFFLHIPEETIPENENQESVLALAKGGVAYLWQNRGILDLILFLSSINLVASIYEAAFPAMMLSREGGSRAAMGIVNTVVGLTTLLGSILASISKEPKSRIPLEIQGRVFAARNTLQFFTIPLGYFLGGVFSG